MKQGLGVLAFSAVLVAFAGPGQANSISYSADVYPIFEKHCLRCHLPGGEGATKSGFDMSSYETVMKGNKFGPLISPGDPEASNLLRMIEGRVAKALRMPHDTDALMSRTKVQTIRRWIKAGALNN